MDHSWGRAVTELGLAHTGATLAARRLGFPQLVLTNASAGPAGYWGWNMSFPDAGFAYVPFTYHYLAGHPHFPGGWEVDPDEPL